MRTDAGRRALLSYDGVGGDLRLDGRWLGRLEGGTARLVTKPGGQLLSLVSIDETIQDLTLHAPQRPPRKLRLGPGAQIDLGA